MLTDTSVKQKELASEREKNNKEDKEENWS